MLRTKPSAGKAYHVLGRAEPTISPQHCSKTNFYSVSVKCSLLSHIQVFATSWTVAHQSPLPMDFYRLEYWSGLPFPLGGIFPTWGSNLHLLHWQADSLPMSHLRNLFSNCPLEKLQQFAFIPATDMSAHFQ